MAHLRTDDRFFDAVASLEDWAENLFDTRGAAVTGDHLPASDIETLSTSLADSHTLAGR